MAPLLVDAAAEVVAPDPHDRDSERADLSYFHSCSLYRRGFFRLDTRRLVIRPLAEELDPLLLHLWVMFRSFNQIEEALDSHIEPLLQLAVRDSAGGVEGFVSLRQREHVRIN